MKTYAFIENGLVWEIVHPAEDVSGDEIPLAARFTPEYCAQCIDITAVSPTPEPNWSAKQAGSTWTFSPASS